MIDLPSEVDGRGLVAHLGWNWSRFSRNVEVHNVAQKGRKRNQPKSGKLVFPLPTSRPGKTRPGSSHSRAKFAIGYLIEVWVWHTTCTT